MTTAALDQIDDLARDLAQQALNGDLDEHDARAHLAGMLLQSNVARSVARSATGLATQQRVDLEENLLDELVGRVLDCTSSFDLRVLASGGSLCGWARKLGGAMVETNPAVRRRGMSGRTRVVDPQPPVRSQQSDGHVGDPYTTAYHAAMAFEGLSTEERVLGDWTEEEVAWAVERATNLLGFARESMRDRATAAALREVLRLPALCVPDDQADRAGILELVHADLTLARRSLVQMASMVCAEPPSRPAAGEAPVGELLLSLWDDYSADDLESLMVRPAQAAHAIVVDALTPLPKPSREAVRALTRSVRHASDRKDWVGTQDGLVVAFLATCTEAVSKFDDTNDADAKARKEAAARDAASRWPVLAARVAAFPGAPLGESVEQVGCRMRELLEEARSKDADARIATRRRRGLAGRAEAAAA